MKDSTVSSDLAFPNHAHHGDFFLVGLRSPADLGTCLFTGDRTHSLLDPKLNTHGDVAAKQVYGIHVRASYSLENKKRPKHGYARCVGRRNGRRRGWEPATLEQLGSQGKKWQPLCRPGSPYHIIPPYLLHKTFTRNFNCLGVCAGTIGAVFEKTSVAQGQIPKRLLYG